MKKIVQLLLKINTILLIKKYRPFIVAITGSVGKTSTKNAIFDVFSKKKNIRKSFGNLNTEIGAPLVFLGIVKSGENIIDWIFIFLKGLWLLLKKDKNYPEIVVVEMAADKPGDIEYLSNFIKPDVAILTAIGEVPVHIEYYKNPEDVAKEKEMVVSALKKEGVAILNIDDKHIEKIKERHKDKKIITYGFSKNADIKIKNFSGKSLEETSFLIEKNKKDYSILLKNCLGEPFAYFSAIIFSLADVFNIKDEDILELTKEIKPTQGRMYPLRGKKGSVILDGSYNASPSSVMSSLKTLKEVQGKRKIAVLGDMLELSIYKKEEHQKIAKIAKSFCDYLFFIGEEAEELKSFVIEDGFCKDKVFSFLKSDRVSSVLEKIIEKEDIILIKGSQGIRTEKVVFGIMENQKNAKNLLVRQSDFWKNKK